MASILLPKGEWAAPPGLAPRDPRAPRGFVLAGSYWQRGSTVTYSFMPDGPVGRGPPPPSWRGCGPGVVVAPAPGVPGFAIGPGRAGPV
jgi:hypothetical protein